MSGFRLARLLKLRDEQAKAAKQQWALAQRAVTEASAELESSEARLGGARADLLKALGGRHEQGQIQRALNSHQTLDGLERAIAARHEHLEARKQTAQGLRLAYEHAMRGVEALSRLEDRWKSDQRARRRRREERVQDEFIAQRAIRRDDDDLQNTSTSPTSTGNSEGGTAAIES